jgi:hypothetical protein
MTAGGFSGQTTSLLRAGLGLFVVLGLSLVKGWQQQGARRLAMLMPAFNKGWRYVAGV